ncbi:MAG TPA: ABC transporter permease [Firmicutes bacterium]|nr:ABC transporter permease [Bacillota bacterium]
MSVVWLGVLGGLLVGAAMGLIMAYMCVSLYANQAITGIVLNIFGLGITGFTFRLMYGFCLIPPRITPLPVWRVPYLSELPVVGPVLFQQPPIVYLSLLLVPAVSWLLFRSSWGLRLRAVGGDARAADAMGIDVRRVRYAALLLGGALAGLAGACLTVGIGMFSEGMSANRGYIALALVMFSRWQPGLALGGALLFGLADSLQLRIQSLGLHIPYQFLLMLPYILTIVVLVMGKKGGMAPSVVGIPYRRERKGV